MFDKNSIDIDVLATLEARINAADNEILGGDLMIGMQTKKGALNQIVSLCEKNDDEEQLAVYRDKYAKEFPKIFADKTKLSKFKHLNG